MMKKHLFALLVSFLMAAVPSLAQSWTKKAAKTVFTLKTFDTTGTLLGSGYGVFTDEQGTALSTYTPFRGASSAVVIDAAGKEWPVALILGASETYDVVKLRVALKKSAAAPLAAAAPQAGATVWMLPYREQKNATQGTMRKTETFAGGYDYYTLRLTMPEEGAGLPLFDVDGQLLALMQSPEAATDTLCYAVSALFADSLKMTGLSINDPALRATNIKKALPDDVEQARLSLFVGAQALDSAAYAQLVNDFISAFPTEPDGYITRAQLHAAATRYADTDNDISLALTRAERPDETHYSYSRIIYNKLVYTPQPPYDPWTLDKALAEARAAYEASPQPIYQQQQAYVLFSQKEYAQAAAIYDQLRTTPMRSPDLFLEAASCQLMQADTTAYLALLDSAVSLFSRPYLREAAPYILQRAQARLETGRYREAVSDLNDYEQLMVAQVNDQFYYLRFQAESGARQFQQALNDISRALQMNPTMEFYYAEKASLEVRVGLYDQAIATARECIELAPQYSDGHLFLGLALCLQGHKAEGVKSLQRARELGDEQADTLIEKYGK